MSIKLPDFIEFSSNFNIGIMDEMIHFIAKPKCRYLGDHQTNKWDNLEIHLYSNAGNIIIANKLLERNVYICDDPIIIKMYISPKLYWEIVLDKIVSVDFGFITKEEIEKKFNIPSTIKIIASVSSCKIMGY